MALYRAVVQRLIVEVRRHPSLLFPTKNDLSFHRIFTSSKFVQGPWNINSNGHCPHLKPRINRDISALHDCPAAFNSPILKQSLPLTFPCILSSKSIFHVQTENVGSSSHLKIASCQRSFPRYQLSQRTLHNSTTLITERSISSVNHSVLKNQSFLSSQSFLKKVPSTRQDSHHLPRSFSVAQSILDSSPSAIQPYLRLMRFEKPIGTFLLYWPCTWSIALAAQPGCLPDLKMLALFGAGSFFMRSAGCIINDMWDKDFDDKVARTKQRPLASGELSYFQASVFLGCNLSISLAILLQLNWYTVFLGMLSLGLVVTYPLAKRITYWPQIMLGLAFNYGALVGWSAIRGSVDWSVCLTLYASCIFWTLIYDTIYAHQDKYDDILIGVKSTALRLGDKSKPWLTGFAAIMSGGLVSCGVSMEMPWPYYVGVSLTLARLLQQIYVTDLDNVDECGHAFRDNFYLGVIMFAGIVLANLMKPKQQESETTDHDLNTLKEV